MAKWAPVLCHAQQTSGRYGVALNSKKPLLCLCKKRSFILKFPCMVPYLICHSYVPIPFTQSQFHVLCSQGFPSVDVKVHGICVDSNNIQ